MTKSELYKDFSTKLNNATKNARLMDRIIKDKELSKNMSRGFDVLKWLSSDDSEREETTKLMTKYEDEGFKYSITDVQVIDIEDAEDEANYINNYFKNILRVDLDDVKVEKKVKPTKTKFGPKPGTTEGAAGFSAGSQKSDSNKQESFNSNQQSFNSNPHQQQRQQGFNPWMGGALPNGYKNPLTDPNFYPYDRKPKTTKYMKIALVVFLLTYLGIQLANMFVMFYASTNKVPFAYKESTGAWKNTVNSISGMSVVTSVLMMAITMYLVRTVLKKPTTERAKFVIEGMIIVLILIIAGMGLIQTLTAPIKLDAETITKNQDLGNTEYVSLMHKTTLIQQIKIGVSGAGILIAVLALVLNPKLDREKYMRTLQEAQRDYMEQMNNSFQNQQNKNPDEFE